MIKLLLVFVAITAIFADDCQPLYWEIDPNYQVPLDETAIVASQQIVLKDVSTTSGVLRKRHYTVFDIKGSGVYNDSKVKTEITDKGVSVTGAVIDLRFQLYLMAKGHGKGYDGNQTASLKNITVNYTKVPEVIKGVAAWKLANLSPSIPNNLVSNNDSSPPFIISEDKKHFDDLISTDLYAEVSAYYNMNLSSMYAKVLQTQSLSKTFNTSAFYTYFYPGGAGSAIHLNVSVGKFQISKANGFALGYLGQVQGVQPRCSSFVPDYSVQASYLTQELILGIFDGFAHTKVWQPANLDGSFFKGNYFKFKMVDLDAISPSVTAKFTNLLEPLSALCYLKTTIPVLEFDQDNQTINTFLDWTCDLVRSSDFSQKLITISSTIKYYIRVQQIADKLSVRIKDTQLIASTWIPTNYPIVNEDLANAYLKDVVYNSLSLKQTLGDGFVQPNRISPSVTIEKTYIKIVDEAAVIKEQ